MPPSITTVLDNVNAITRDVYLPRLIDGVFKSNPLLMRLISREAVLLSGGRNILQPLLYDKSPADAYEGLELLSSEDPETVTDLAFNYKFYHAPVVVRGVDDVLNDGEAAILDQAATKMEIAEMSLKDQIGADLCSDGTRRSGVITGIQAAIDDGTGTTTYGGIARTTGPTTLQTAVKANADKTGGNVTLGLLNTEYGKCTIANTRPDLALTTQPLFDKVWNIAQPHQRFPASPDSPAPMARLGFRTIMINEAEIVVDSHVASGEFYWINTEYVKFIIASKRNFRFREWQVPVNQDSMIGRIFFAGELVVNNPRTCSRITGLT